MERLCTGCGMAAAVESGGEKELYCVARRRPVAGPEAAYCLYYMPPVVEEGEALSPRQHLLLKEDEFLRKK